MANTIQLEVITPERRVFNERVEFFALRGGAGELGVLPGHIPLFSTVETGLLRYKKNGETRVITLMGGFLNVQPDKATVLTDAAELGEEVDIVRARLAKERAEILLSRQSEQNETGAQASLERALVRLRAVELVGLAPGRR